MNKTKKNQNKTSELEMLEKDILDNYQVDKIKQSIQHNLQTRKNTVNAIIECATDYAEISDLFMLLNYLNREAVELEAELLKVVGGDKG